jgi:hypothetical protein
MQASSYAQTIALKVSIFADIMFELLKFYYQFSRKVLNLTSRCFNCLGIALEMLKKNGCAITQEE